MGDLKTIGENVDDFIFMIARVGNMTTQEAVDFIVWRVKKYPPKEPNEVANE